MCEHIFPDDRIKVLRNLCATLGHDDKTVPRAATYFSSPGTPPLCWPLYLCQTFRRSEVEVIITRLLPGNPLSSI